MKRWIVVVALLAMLAGGWALVQRDDGPRTWVRQLGSARDRVTAYERLGDPDDPAIRAALVEGLHARRPAAVTRPDVYNSVHPPALASARMAPRRTRMNIGNDGFSLWPLSRPAPRPDSRESLSVKDLLDDERLRRMLTN